MEGRNNLSFSYRISQPTVSLIVKEASTAIWDAPHQVYVRQPQCTEDWKNISRGFEETWNFAHCIGAVDGKHVATQCPIKSGSLYYNYKGFFSIVLLAACDGNYTFTVIDISSYGSNNDNSVLNSCNFGKAMEAGSLGIPPSKPTDGILDFSLP